MYIDQAILNPLCGNSTRLQVYAGMVGQICGTLTFLCFSLGLEGSSCSQVHERAGEAAEHYVRFVPEGAHALGVEVELQLVPGPGPPASWALMQGIGASQAEGAEPPECVQCGVPFTIDVEAHDAFGNRCE